MGIVIVASLACGRTHAIDDGAHARTQVQADASVRVGDAGDVLFVPDASPGATVDDEELRRALHKFGGEEGVGIGGAEEWLVAHPDRARPALVAILESDQIGIHIKHVARTLGRIAHPDDVPLFRRLLLEGEELKVKWVADALAINPSAEAFDALVEGTATSDVDIIRAAVRALADRGDERARPSIEARLDHDDRAVRSAVIYSLQKLGVEPSRALLEARRKVERDAHVKKLLAKVLGSK